MKKILYYVFMLTMAVTMVAGIGCAAMSEYITPGNIDQRSVDYAVKAGIADPDFYAGYPSLYKVKRLEIDVASAHEVNMLALEHAVNEEELNANLLRGIVERNRSEAAALEEAIFDPTTGLLAVGLGALGIAGGGVLGLMRTKPGDWKPADVEDALTDLTVQIGDKERQFIETVKGIQEFIDKGEYDEDNTIVSLVDAVADLKVILAGAQSTDTKKAVAVAKTA